MKRIILLFLIAVFLTACAAPAEFSVSGVQAWVDQPIGGTVLPVGSFTLKAHARHDSGSGVNKIEFLVNGVSVGSVDTDPNAPLVYAETTWNASAPGTYQVSARAYAGAESSESSVVLVCVSQDVTQAGFASDGFCSVSLQAPPSNGDAITVTEESQNPNEPATVTPTPTFTSVPPSVVVPPTLTFTSVPPSVVVPPTLTFTPVPPTDTSAPSDTQGPNIKSLFHSAPGYYGGCAGTFTMQALGVTDPSGISSVIFGYRYEGGSTSGYYTAAGSFTGNGTYELTIDNNSSNQAYNTLQGANGFIRWYVQVQDGAGNITTIGDQVGEILYCPG